MTGAERAKPLVLVAACALVDDSGRVLISQRPEGKPLAGLWEFPGGKLEDGETPEHGLIRELDEELGIAIAPSSLIPLMFSSFSYADFNLLMPLFACWQWSGDVTPKEGQALVWAAPAALQDYAMPPADEPLKGLLPGLLDCVRSASAGS
ncbi:(deoxy)nucleoside triphosphate pyrophosphohydrolase [Methyloceanibacter caenitepidi]|uniref:8-oxo-dGTP diphosphatase n=1 Tax=Methyloceanibacter caenitepidi TaxID=1384459 RepID=A0A0A8K7B0_9HYPH|nr:(deoxy)nucleoside triphosphate pyrophosphohydrolase [Methyloceanibacter caenitepidi]BAQ18706.1 5-methyl-dCTP pyrophosphohydrolase [Methyloceanibacter caenitepidi]